ncbi:MAG: multicomponent Na+:H+ antiporter subunit D [Kiritimatiellia bacterium]
MSPSEVLIFALCFPVGMSFIIRGLGRWPNLREAVTLLTAGTLFYQVCGLVPHVMAGESITVLLAAPAPGIEIRFDLEPLGMLFALIASGLWIITTIFAIGYMRGNDEKNQSRFFMCFAIAIGAVMGIAFAGNMFTLFIFYEVLTLSTFPLVTHKGDAASRKSGRIYLGILLSTSVLFLLLGTVWVYVLAGSVDFQAGGVMTGKIDPKLGLPLLALFVFGIGKAAVMPFHKWLPAAMVAPTPVSALLHAVAVVKAGVFSVLKVSIYLFGIDFIRDSGAGEVLMWAAAATILLASMVAMTKDNLKARLAYSTISQLSYIVLGAMIATAMSVKGSALHIAMHAVGKITLFFCAGAIYTKVHKTNISQLDGLGRKMPLTFAAFFIGSLSIIGLPPCGGSWSKWYLILGAADAGQFMMIVVFMISSLLNVAYLLPIPIRAFFRPARDETSEQDPVGQEAARFRWDQVDEASFCCVFPPVVTALGCIVLFFSADTIMFLINRIPLS